MNLNQVKKYLKDWFTANPFINTVIVSTKDDFSEVNNVNYPVTHIEYLSNQTNTHYNNYSFIITIADIQNSKLKYNNIEEIQNNCNLIAQDFIDFHSENNEYFEFDENIMINIFEESHIDRTAGVTFAVRLSVFREKNTCVIPTKD